MIIPVYNVRPYIEEALNSVIEQTYRDLEIIIIDDGSMDGSGDICDKYGESDSRIIVIHEENRGLSAARNAGLDIATGDMISFLDPDDAIHPNMISRMMQIMEKCHADICICDFSLHRTKDRMEDGNNGNPNIRVLNMREAFRNVVDGHINTAVWNKLYRREIWRGLRFPEGRIYEGTYLSLDIFDRAKSIAITEEKLVMHRIRPGSICNTSSLKHVQDAVFALDHRIAFIKERIPDLFSEEFLYREIQHKVKGLIIAYEQSFYRTELKQNRKTIRGMLDEARSEVRCCDLFIRATFHMALSLPRFSLMFFLPYRLSRKIIVLIRG